MAWSVQEGIAQFEILRHARSYLRAFVYTPQAVLRALDMAGGVCNLKAYEVIQKTEFLSRGPFMTSKGTQQCFHMSGKLRLPPKE